MRNLERRLESLEAAVGGDEAEFLRRIAEAVEAIRVHTGLPPRSGPEHPLLGRQRAAPTVAEPFSLLPDDEERALAGAEDLEDPPSVAQAPQEGALTVVRAAEPVAAVPAPSGGTEGAEEAINPYVAELFAAGPEEHRPTIDAREAERRRREREREAKQAHNEALDREEE